MTARDDVLANRYSDNPAAQTARAAAGASDIAEIFASFVGYASANWNYAAQPGAQTAAGLLEGDGTKTVACGTLRDALKIMLREDLKKTVSDASRARVFTKPELNCFDSKVKGNVGYFKSSSFNIASFFSAHYFIEYSGKYYDPCLMAVYATEGGAAAATGKHITERLIQLGTGKDVKFLKQVVGKTLPGFGSVYELIAPHQCSEALSKLEFDQLKRDPQFVAAGLK